MRVVFASAADETYGWHLLNLLGSLKANSDVFDAIVVYDLGLSPQQRRLVDAVPGVEVRRIPPFVAHWAQGFTWKPWIWTHVDADIVFYLDAGATLLRSLRPALDQVRERGYFLVSQENELRDIVPADYFELYGLPASAGDRPYVAAGIIGFATRGPFYDRVIVPTYEDCVAGRSIGFSEGDLHRNRGLAYEAEPVARDCRNFRWDQTILNLRLARELPDAVVADYREYAAWRSPHEHPAQVIWAHRRHASLRYLKRVPYAGAGALRRRLFGAYIQARWWVKLHDRYLRRSTYVWKARKLAGSVRRPSPRH